MNGANPSIWAAIRGPLMLIAVGALFAIDYNGGFRVGRTWPVLVILYGALKLAQHLTTKDDVTKDPGVTGA